METPNSIDLYWHVETVGSARIFDSDKRIVATATSYEMALEIAMQHNQYLARQSLGDCPSL